MIEKHQILHPKTLWAQDKHQVFVTFEVFEAKDISVEFDQNRLTFKSAQSGTDLKYEVDFELYDEIVPEECTEHHTARTIVCKLEKKTGGPFWPRLLKDKVKPHFLSIDFSRWVDEDYEDEDPEAAMPVDPSSFMNMAHMTGAAPGAFQDTIEDEPHFEDSDEEEEHSGQVLID